MSPLSIFSNPAIQFNNVDFPHPDGPTRTKNSPLFKLMFMSFNTLTFPNFLFTFLILKTEFINLSLY